MAVSYIGASSTTTSIANQTITPHASTVTDDLLIYFHLTNADTGTETATISGWNSIYSSIGGGVLLVAMWHIRAGGETTYTSTIANHTTGTTGDSMTEWIETYRGADPATPISAFTASISTWASSLNVGPISTPATTALPVGDMVVLHGGRIENCGGQTTLGTLGLTWGPGPIGDTATGRDCSSVSQHGLNGTAGTVTLTAQTITTTGTAQTGGGRMLVVKAAPAVTIPPPQVLMAPMAPG